MSVNLKLIANHGMPFDQPSAQYKQVLDRLNSMPLDHDFVYNFQKRWFGDYKN
jgi:hypothetical protein